MSEPGHKGRFWIVAVLAVLGFAVGLGIAWLIREGGSQSGSVPLDAPAGSTAVSSAQDPCNGVVCPSGATCVNGVCSIAVPAIAADDRALVDEADLEEDDNSEAPVESSPSARTGAPLATYRARISRRDHENSSGRPHSRAASMIHQDRAWYHRFNQRDPDDEGDPLFADRGNRDWLGDVLEDAIPSDVARQIEQGTPLIEVRVWRNPDRAEVRVVQP